MAEQGITALGATNFKSLRDESRIEIRPLTILAGANSSGKSSIMQPLLLLKQTLEATYDPGVLLLSGPNVQIVAFEELLFKKDKNTNKRLSVYVEVDNRASVTNSYSLIKRPPRIELNEAIYGLGSLIHFQSNRTEWDIVGTLPKSLLNMEEELPNPSWHVTRKRCFLNLELKYFREPLIQDEIPSIPVGLSRQFVESIEQAIHVPGLRNYPERLYKATNAIGPTFPGTFENYAASIISYWQETDNAKSLELAEILQILGLTWKVMAKRLQDTQIELRVARLPKSTRGGSQDMVSIADVGFGVSQVLPVLVALLVAEEGQLVYLEQPEIHLHPRAQVALAQIFADAANRGVKVVAETHSDLLLLGVQTLVAEGKLAPEKVKLHWFSRGDDGATTISSRDLDETGSYGDWPEDFGETTLTAQSHFMDAAEAHQAEN